MTDNKENNLEAILELHQKEIWEWKMKEPEWIKTDNQLEGCKKIIVELSAKIVQLKKDIDRLAEENSNIRTIESSHKELNGKLQTKITDTENEIALLKGIGNNSPEMRDLKKDNKYLAEKVEAYREQLRKAGL